LAQKKTAFHCIEARRARKMVENSQPAGFPRSKPGDKSFNIGPVIPIRLRQKVQWIVTTADGVRLVAACTTGADATVRELLS
jgi:hypothetical protein